MGRRAAALLLPAGVAIAIAACVGEDPNVFIIGQGEDGGPGGSVDAEPGVASGDAAREDAAPADATPDRRVEADAAPDATDAGAAYAYFSNNVYPLLMTSCQGNSSCHGEGAGSVQFFGGDASTTYLLFKAKGFHKKGSNFVQHGLHLGPALTPSETVVVSTWVSLESPAQ